MHTYIHSYMHTYTGYNSNPLKDLVDLKSPAAASSSMAPSELSAPSTSEPPGAS